MHISKVNSALLPAAIVLVALPWAARAGQQPEAPAPQTVVSPPATTQDPTANSGTVRLSLQDALTLARKNSPQFQSAQIDQAIAREDLKQSRAALLPSLNFNNQDLYTQSNGAGGVRFIANNAVHEYTSQGDVHEVLDLGTIYNLRRQSALAAVARARSEIARRGLVVTVAQGYYAVAAAQLKLEVAQKTAAEGDRFFKITQDLEQGGEVAHSDVIKAELQTRERHRQLQEAELNRLKARLDLAVLIFPDFNDNFEVTEDLHSTVPLPIAMEYQALAARDNPELRVAFASLQAAGSDVFAVRTGYFPSLTLDYFYGIDATRFAKYTPMPGGRVPNLGSSVLASVNIPIWNWGITQSKIKQAELRRTLAQRELSFARRKIVADTRVLYAEAETSLNELSSLSRSSELAAESLRLTTLRYQDGEATVLEVVDAQNTFAQASTAYQDGAVRYRVALASLQTLTGVLTIP